MDLTAWEGGDSPSISVEFVVASGETDGASDRPLERGETPHDRARPNAHGEIVSRGDGRQTSAFAESLSLGGAVRPPRGGRPSRGIGSVVDSSALGRTQRAARGIGRAALLTGRMNTNLADMTVQERIAKLHRLQAERAGGRVPDTMSMPSSRHGSFGSGHLHRHHHRDLSQAEKIDAIRAATAGKQDMMSEAAALYHFLLSKPSEERDGYVALLPRVITARGSNLGKDLHDSLEVHQPAPDGTFLFQTLREWLQIRLRLGFEGTIIAFQCEFLYKPRTLSKFLVRDLTVIRMVGEDMASKICTKERLLHMADLLRDDFAKSADALTAYREIRPTLLSEGPILPKIDAVMIWVSTNEANLPKRSQRATFQRGLARSETEPNLPKPGISYALYARKPLDLVPINDELPEKLESICTTEWDREKYSLVMRTIAFAKLVYAQYPQLHRCFTMSKARTPEYTRIPFMAEFSDWITRKLFPNASRSTISRFQRLNLTHQLMIHAPRHPVMAEAATEWAYDVFVRQVAFRRKQFEKGTINGMRRASSHYLFRTTQLGHLLMQLHEAIPDLLNDAERYRRNLTKVADELGSLAIGHITGSELEIFEAWKHKHNFDEIIHPVQKINNLSRYFRYRPMHILYEQYRVAPRHGQRRSADEAQAAATVQLALRAMYQEECHTLVVDMAPYCTEHSGKLQVHNREVAAASRVTQERLFALMMQSKAKVLFSQNFITRIRLTIDPILATFNSR